MASATGIVLIKTMAYRGVAGEEWSNKYWLTGAPPSTAADWHTLAVTLATAEAAVYHPGSTFVRAYGYNDNTPNAASVWSYDFAAAGESIPGRLGTAANETTMAGDQAAMLEWKTSRKSSKGKYIYLRKYFHHGAVQTTAPDSITNTQKTALDLFGHQLMDNPGLAGRWIRSQKQDEVLQEVIASPWVTTRTLKRRGKRP